MPTVRDLLKERTERNIWSLSPDMTVLEALRAMSDHNVGAMPVLEEGCLLGVFSERDYARKIVLKGRQSNETPVREVMSTDVVTVGLDETLENCLRLMSEKHIRHLPVVEDCKLVGHFSIRDLMQWMIDTQKLQINHLQDYIEGGGYGR
ncbi:MAG: CBS domain-containing protein [Chloroflexi bacterium]|nr:CBS domain-containing protein [Chloroflexota bacterium]